MGVQTGHYLVVCCCHLALSPLNSMLSTQQPPEPAILRRGGFMQRYSTLLVLFLLTVPVGLSIQGCANKNSSFCNGAGFSYTTTQPVSITLGPQITGLSVAYGQIEQLNAPTALTCTG